MGDKNIYACVDGGEYLTTSPNPHVDLDSSSPNSYGIEQLFSDALSDGDTVTITIIKDRDIWAVYENAEFVDAATNQFDLTGATLLDSKGTISTTDTVEVLGINLPPLIELQIAVTNDVSPLVADTDVATFRMPFAMSLSTVRSSVHTAPTGAALIVDINEGGSTILSTKLTIDATEKTSTTAATAAVISDSTLADDAEITIDIDQIGSTVAGTGLIVTLIGRRI